MFKIKKMDLLVSMYIFCIVASEMMGGKTFYLFNIGSFKLNASVAIFLLPIIFTINDIIVEVYGRERARSLIRSSLVVIVMIIIFSLIATTLPASTRFSGTEKAYDTIFNISIRFSLASLTAFSLAEFLDVFVFHRLREKFGKKRLWMRNNLSNFIAQFVDTTTFMILAFYAFDRSATENFIFIFGLILPYWLLKCSMSIIETPFAYLGVGWLGKERRPVES